MSGIFSSPSPPPPPPPPPAPPAAPKESGPSKEERREKALQAQREAQRRGRASLIFAGRKDALQRRAGTSLLNRKSGG